MGANGHGTEPSASRSKHAGQDSKKSLEMCIAGEKFECKAKAKLRALQASNLGFQVPHGSPQGAVYTVKHLALYRLSQAPAICWKNTASLEDDPEDP